MSIKPKTKYFIASVMIFIISIFLILLGYWLECRWIAVIGCFPLFYGCIGIAAYTADMMTRDDDDGPRFYGPGGTVI